MTPSQPTLSLVNNGDETVTATISHADAGSTIDLYFLRIPEAFHAVSWVHVGTRTGNGGITVAMARGQYLFHAKSTLVGVVTDSAPVALQVSVSGGSLLNQILSGVKARVSAIGLSGIESNNIHIATVADGQHFMELSDPGIVICAAGTQQFLDDDSVPHGFWRTGWTVMVVLAKPANRDQTNMLREQWFLWREQIEQELVYQRWPLVGGIMISPVPTPSSVVFDRDWWKSNALGSPISMYYRVDREVRATT